MQLIAREEAWRGMIAREATFKSFEHLAEAIAKWVLKEQPQPQVMIGYDTRFLAEEFSMHMAEVLLKYGVDVFLSTRFSSTAMLGLASTKRQMHAAIMLTGGELAAAFTGLQVLDAQGAQVRPQEIELFLSTPAPTASKVGSLAYFDVEAVYYNHLKEIFDTKKLKAFGSKFCYDVHYGTAQRVLKKLFPTAEALHASRDVLFGEKNHFSTGAPSLSACVQAKAYDFGFSIKGDAGRLQLWHSSGLALDYQWSLLLMIYVLAVQQRAEGKILLVKDSAPQAVKLAEHFGMKLSYCEKAELFVQSAQEEGVLLAGDEQGYLALYGNIMLPDAVFVLMELVQYLQQQETTLQTVVDQIEAILSEE